MISLLLLRVHESCLARILYGFPHFASSVRSSSQARLIDCGLVGEL